MTVLHAITLGMRSDQQRLQHAPAPDQDSAQQHSSTHQELRCCFQSARTQTGPERVKHSA
jgi:hypothetical protein